MYGSPCGLWGHDGGIVGYLSAAFHDVRSGVTVAVRTKRFGPRRSPSRRLAPGPAALARELVED